MLTRDKLEALSEVGERWEQVRGSPTTWVSNFGRLAKTGKNRAAPMVSVGTRNRYGYRVTCLTTGYKTRQHKLVHRLVVDAFIGDVPRGMCVNHRDGNKENNRAENLEVVTFRANIQHGVALGLIKSSFPADMNRRRPVQPKRPRLTPEQRAEAVVRLRASEPAAWIAKDFGVGIRAIKALRDGLGTC